MSITAITKLADEEIVRGILEDAGPRGASHEDFVEAGMAAGYIAALRHLVDEDGLAIRVDFTTGQPRWAVTAAATNAARQLRAA
ncbi:MAG: hypothetical protein QOJ29_4579 [Thermoleophilaceae bacterium]|nr:hypothetical protein [Thermoleophilaceae bacterium]